MSFTKYVVSLVIFAMKSTKGLEMASATGVLIFFTSTLINPTIYYIKIPEYKEAFHLILGRDVTTS